MVASSRLNTLSRDRWFSSSAVSEVDTSLSLDVIYNPDKSKYQTFVLCLNRKLRLSKDCRYVPLFLACCSTHFDRSQVRVMTDAVVGQLPSSPHVPTSDEYIGCFTDLIADRVLTTVSTDDFSMDPTVSIHSCNRTSGRTASISCLC